MSVRDARPPALSHDVARPTLGVMGAGWVGLVTAAGFAELGHNVIVRDVVAERVRELRLGAPAIYEPGLAELIERQRPRMRFTLDAADVFADAHIVFICVGTPAMYSGDADLSAVWDVLAEVPRLAEPPILVMKSTVPVGTGERVRAELAARNLDDVGYVSNPEFLAEGTAVRDFRRPSRWSSARSTKRTPSKSPHCMRTSRRRCCGRMCRRRR